MNGNWGRYLDVDGDGIPYRTVPGNHHPASAYFTRGTGHDEYARYTEDAGTWEAQHGAPEEEIRDGRVPGPKPVIERSKGATSRHHRLRLDRCGRRRSRARMLNQNRA